MGVQLRQVAHARHRRGPIALQVADPPLDARLLLRPPRQTKQRQEGVMANQRLVTLVEPPLATDEQLRRYRLGVVPPQLARHTAEELKRLDQPEEDCLGALARQGQRERVVGRRPGHQQHRDQTPAVREVDMDMPEVGLQTLPGRMIQRDEGLAALAVLAEHVVADALVAARVAVLVPQTAKELGHRVTLLARRLEVAAQDVVDDGLKRIDHRRHRPPPIRLGFGLREDLADLVSRMAEASGQFADAQLLQTVGLPDTRILVHLDHPPPPCSWRPRRGTSVQED
jgi:hypothetical protein